MSKITEFYAKVLADRTAKNEFLAILENTSIDNASDEQLAKVGELAKKLGFDITMEEAKAYLSGDNSELDEDDLDAVAGGGKYDKSVIEFVRCEIGGNATSS
ncbi:MAG: hypothetical protein ACI4JN_00990 [Ruminococcus sp.]